MAYLLKKNLILSIFTVIFLTACNSNNVSFSVIDIIITGIGEDKILYVPFHDQTSKQLTLYVSTKEYHNDHNHDLLNRMVDRKRTKIKVAQQLLTNGKVYSSIKGIE